MKDILQKLPAQVEGEVYRTTTETAGARFANSQFEETFTSSNTRTTLRIIQEGRMSISSSGKPSPQEDLLRNCQETVAYGRPVDYALPSAAAYATMDIFDEQLASIDLAAMIELAAELNDALVAYDRQLRVGAAVRKLTTAVEMANSQGLSASYQKTIWSATLSGRLIQGEDMLGLGESLIGCHYQNDLSKVKSAVIEAVDQARETAPLAAGHYPVIFAPEQVAFLLRPLLACLSGKAIADGISPWQDRLGEALLAPSLTLVDDATAAGKASSQPFDRDGVPTRRHVLIEAGIPQGLLLDLPSAQRLGMSPTGHGTLGGPAAHHLVVTPGTQEVADLIAGIPLGVIIFDSMGAWAGNPYSGLVSGTISRGIKIENGRLAGRIKNCMFTTNVFEQLKNQLRDISQETKDLGHATFPYLALDEVLISTT